MDEIKDTITDYIRRNRVSTTEIADCLGKTGAIPNVRPIKAGMFCVGNVYWVYTYGESNWPLHEQIREVAEGDIVLVHAYGCQNRALFGDIVSKFLLLYRQARAIVVAGYLRDAHRLVKEGWPIWCEGFTPVGCFNRKLETPFDAETVRQGYENYHGAIAVCDDSGVVVIPKAQHTAEFIRKMETIEQQEDIWYECIDRRKWNTFDTVCLKKYLEPGGGPGGEAGRTSSTPAGS